jgi:hypothetical protein
MTTASAAAVFVVGTVSPIVGYILAFEKTDSEHPRPRKLRFRLRNYLLFKCCLKPSLGPEDENCPSGPGNEAGKGAVGPTEPIEAEDGTPASGTLPLPGKTPTLANGYRGDLLFRSLRAYKLHRPVRLPSLLPPRAQTAPGEGASPLSGETMPGMAPQMGATAGDPLTGTLVAGRNGTTSLSTSTPHSDATLTAHSSNPSVDSPLDLNVPGAIVHVGPTRVARSASLPPAARSHKVRRQHRQKTGMSFLLQRRCTSVGTLRLFTYGFSSSRRNPTSFAACFQAFGAETLSQISKICLQGHGATEVRDHSRESHARASPTLESAMHSAGKWDHSGSHSSANPRLDNAMRSAGKWSHSQGNRRITASPIRENVMRSTGK